MVKPRLYNDEDTTKKAAIWTLKKVLIDALKLLHPYMPFITEEIFCNIQDEEESIMISAWPVYSEVFNFAEDENAIETIKQAVRNIRNVRAEMNVAPSRKAKVFVVSEDAKIRDILKTVKSSLQHSVMPVKWLFSRIRAESRMMPYQRLSRMQLSTFRLQSL